MISRHVNSVYNQWTICDSRASYNNPEDQALVSTRRFFGARRLHDGECNRRFNVSR